MKGIQKMNLYHYTECGLDNIYLVNGFQEHEMPDGELGVSISDIDKLHLAITKNIIKSNNQLKGREIKFLRSELTLSQKGLADLLGKDVQTVARWEKGVVNIEPAADRLIRFICQDAILNKRPQVCAILQDLAEIEESEYIERKFSFNNEGNWMSECA